MPHGEYTRSTDTVCNDYLRPVVPSSQSSVSATTTFSISSAASRRRRCPSGQWQHRVWLIVGYCLILICRISSLPSLDLILSLIQRSCNAAHSPRALRKITRTWTAGNRFRKKTESQKLANSLSIRPHEHHYPAWGY